MNESKIVCKTCYRDVSDGAGAACRAHTCARRHPRHPGASKNFKQAQAGMRYKRLLTSWVAAMSFKNQMPPLIQWRAFANWIGMEDDHKIVKKWLEQGLLPSKTIGNQTMVNMVALKLMLLKDEN